MSTFAQHWRIGQFSEARRTPLLTCGQVLSLRIVSACVWLLLLSFNRIAVGQPASASAPAIKAAFVLNFMKFVEWPKSAFSGPDAPLVLCVSGASSDLIDALQSLDGRSVQGRPLSIRSDIRPGEQQSCNAAYLGGDAAAMRGETINTAGTVLTVGDSPGFAAAGGMIGLYSEDGKIRFEINAGSVQRSALRISSQLMKLARIADNKRSGDSK